MFESQYEKELAALEKIKCLICNGKGQWPVEQFMGMDLVAECTRCNGTGIYVKPSQEFNLEEEWRQIQIRLIRDGASYIDREIRDGQVFEIWQLPEKK